MINFTRPYGESTGYFESEPEIVIPNLDPYENDEEHQTHMPEVDEITPEAMENYVGAEIMVSSGDTVYQWYFPPHCASCA